MFKKNYIVISKNVSYWHLNKQLGRVFPLWLQKTGLPHNAGMSTV